MLTKDIGRALRNRFRPRHGFFFLNLQIEFNIRLLLVFGAKSFVLLIDIKNQFLDMTTSYRVFVVIPRADLDVEWFTGTLLSSTAFTSQPELDLFLLAL